MQHQRISHLPLFVRASILTWDQPSQLWTGPGRSRLPRRQGAIRAKAGYTHNPVCTGCCHGHVQDSFTQHT